MTSAALQYQARWRKSTDPDTSWSAPVAVGADGHINVPGLQQVSDYVFQARARSGCGAWSAWAVQLFNHPQLTYPAPSLPNVTGAPDGVHVVFGPDPQSGDLWYEIQRAPDNGGAPGAWATVAKTQSTVWDDVVTDANQYWYRFRTIDYQGNASDWVMISNPVAVSVSTPAINEAVQAANAAIGQTQQDVTNLQTQADSTLAQVETIQGQVGDILQADVWDATKTYPLGDLVQYSGKLYRSLIDGNLNHQPAGATDANWEYIGNYASLGEAVGANAAQVAVLNNTVSQQGDDITANSQSIAQNAAAIGTKADSSALQATNATVTQQGNTLTSQGQSLTALTNTVNDPNTGLGTKASSAALTSLSGTVTQHGTDITAAQQDITTLQGNVGTLNSRVDSETTARQSGDDANAQAITAVQAALAGAGGNLFPNPSGAQGFSFPAGVFAGWVGGSQQDMGTTPPDFGNNLFGNAGPWFDCHPGGSQSIDEGFAVKLGCAAGPVTVSADLEARCVASGTMTVSVRFYNASGVEIDSTNRPTITATNGIGSTRYSVSGTAPAGTAYCQSHQRITGTLSVPYAVGWRRIKVEATAAATPFSDDATQAASASAAFAMQANVTAGGQSYAQATLMVDANGNVALMRMNANGTTSNIVFKADSVSIVGSSAAGSTTFAGGLMTVKDSAGNTVIQLGLLP